MIASTRTMARAPSAAPAARRRPLARRLMLAFGGMVVLFAIASAGVLAALGRIQEGMSEVTREQEGMRFSLELASAVRDQYAHQAHTIILGNLSHLGLYSAAAAHVRELTAEVRRRATTDEERALVDEIARMSSRLDRIFTGSIVPAVSAGDHGTVEIEHGRGLQLVTSIQQRADALASRFEASIAALNGRVRDLQRAVSLGTLAFLGLSVAGAALLALALGRSIARPVAVLEAGAARLASGDLSGRIELDRDDELGALARQFNAMTESLREHQERLVQSEKLAGIGRLAAGVAHEINNPLGVILGYARVLRRSASGELADDLAIIEEEVQRAREIVDGLLDLARPPRLQLESVDLRELCDEVRARIVEAGIPDAVTVRVSGEGTVLADGPKLRQIVWNLVKNAVEATGEGGRVDLEVSADADGGRVRVCDDGSGLGPEARERLFEPFFTTKSKGTGLGLAVSRALARAHGGDIEARGDSGRGACFTLRLPAGLAPAAGE